MKPSAAGSIFRAYIVNSWESVQRPSAANDPPVQLQQTVPWAGYLYTEANQLSTQIMNLHHLQTVFPPCRISCSHSRGYKEFCILGYNSM
jgi:hypothetical protein